MITESLAVQDWLTKISQYNAKNIDLGLDRVKLIADKLGLRNFQCPVILVGGTNGKGSCVHYLDSIYRHAGYNVGISTSPHLHRINERLQINGQEIDDESLINAFEKIEAARGNTALTYFEFTTLAFLYILKYQKLDVIILEIGLGGRLDAMNIVEPDLSIITSIDLDHMEYLGSDRESIGREKAGIFRARKPAICGDPNPPQSILEVAKELNTELHLVTSNSIAIELLQQKLPVEISNLSINISCLPGRFEVINKAPLIIVDVAHNPAACKLLSERIKVLNIEGNIFSLASFLKDKDISGCLEPMKNVIDEWHIAELQCERAAKIHDLSKKITDISKRECYTHLNIKDGLEAIIKKAKNDDLCIVFGSFFTVAEARETLL